MALDPGTRIGAYEILGSLGAGGMGEVYRARDIKLNRDVAIKVLPDLFADDPDRLARFQREAHVLASLNHPNIAHILGMEDRALVMELVEGPDLSAMLSGGPLALVDALPIARQIADALEAAHEQGIVHRDLKPGNVKVKPDGTVKVLDFGLAKALTPDSGPGTPDSQNSPTLTARATQMGMILGTAAYMAPEQARGRAVDRRADIWAFGVVLYEMLAGRRAFEGEDVSITLASVLKEDVQWNALPADLPASINRVLRRCLEKDPRKRLSSISDARLELDDASAPSEPTAATAPPPKNSRTAWIAAAASMIVAITAVAFAFWPRPAAPSPERMQFEMVTVGEMASSVLAPQISPNGRYLAYVSPPPTGGPTRVWVRRMQDTKLIELAGTEGAQGLFWSADSLNLGFHSNNKVYRVSVDGSAPVPLCDFSSYAGGTWSASGDILLATTGTGGGRVFRVRETGGEPVEVARGGGENPAAFLWPTWLPDGRHFVALGAFADERARGMYLLSVDGGKPVKLMQSGAMGTYAAPGFILFMNGNSVFAQRFDASSLSLSGDPVKILDGVLVQAPTGRAGYSVSSNGVLAYRPSLSTDFQSDLVWSDRSGKVSAPFGPAKNYYQIRLSPDDKRVTYAEADSNSFNYKLGVIDVANGVASTVTDDKQFSNDPVWSPDGETIAYEAIRGRPGRQLFTHRVGNLEPALVFESPDDPKWLDDWSADGRYLLFHLPKPSKLYALPLAEPRTPIKLADTPETIDGAHFSPDGKWIAYMLTESGQYQIWLASFPAFDKRQRLSPAGGGQPTWSRDSKELFYITYSGKLMSVRFKTRSDGSLEAAAPVELFQSPIPSPLLGVDQFAVAKDGRFLFARPRGGYSRAPIAVVVNWASGLK